MTRKPRAPKPYESAPRPAIYPLGEADRSIINRWLLEGRQSCGTCEHLALEEPINLTSTCYCTRRLVWQQPWNHQPATGDDPCDHFEGRESTI